MKSSVIRLTLLALSFATALAFASCNRHSPALVIAGALNDIAASIDKAPDIQQAHEAIEHESRPLTDRINSIIEQNPDYELTPDDKAAIKASLRSIMEVSMKKSLETSGEKPEGIDATINSLMELNVYPAVDNARQLSDLARQVNLSPMP